MITYNELLANGDRPVVAKPADYNAFPGTANALVMPGTGSSWMDAYSTPIAPIFEAVTKAGHCALTTDAGVDQFGNERSRTGIHAAIDWAYSAPIHVRTAEFHGFGFSQAFGRATEFKNAASGLQKQALDLLFDTSKGAGFSIIRNRIGSGGPGDSIEPTSPGSPSNTPKYTFDNNDSGQFWFTQQAVRYGVKTIYADAWSAPGFMKTSGSDATPGYAPFPYSLKPCESCH